MTVPPRAQTRILVGAGSFADATAALRIVGRLAGDLNVACGGLLIEDREMLDMCRLPNMRIVSAGGSLVFAPSPAQLRTVIEADAKAFQRSLADLAGLAGIAWSFEKAIGDLVQEALTASSGWDIIVVGHRNLHPMRGKIVSLTATASVDDALDVFSDQLANTLLAEHLVLSIGDNVDSPPGTHVFADLRGALAALARMNLQAVLLDLSHGPIRTPDELRQVLEVSRCPLFVFGAAALYPDPRHSPSA